MAPATVVKPLLWEKLTELWIPAESEQLFYVVGSNIQVLGLMCLFLPLCCRNTWSWPQCRWVSLTVYFRKQEVDGWRFYFLVSGWSSVQLSVIVKATLSIFFKVLKTEPHLTESWVFLRKRTWVWGLVSAAAVSVLWWQALQSCCAIGAAIGPGPAPAAPSGAWSWLLRAGQHSVNCFSG